MRAEGVTRFLIKKNVYCTKATGVFFFRLGFGQTPLTKCEFSLPEVPGSLRNCKISQIRESKKVSYKENVHDLSDVL